MWTLRDVQWEAKDRARRRLTYEEEKNFALENVREINLKAQHFAGYNGAHLIELLLPYVFNLEVGMVIGLFRMPMIDE